MAKKQKLLTILFQRSPLAIRETSSSGTGTIRARAVRPRRGTPFRKRDNWLLPTKVLEEIRLAEAESKVGIPADVESVVVVARSVVASKQLDISHVGAALRQIEVKSLQQISRDTNFTVNLGGSRAIGLQRCVCTSRSDQSFWAQYRDQQGRIILGPHGEPIMRRFVTDRSPLETSDITLVIRYSEYRLRVIAAYYGGASRKIPGTTDATREDSLWWYNPETGEGHALVVTQDMLPRIVTKSTVFECPWKI